MLSSFIREETYRGSVLVTSTSTKWTWIKKWQWVEVISKCTNQSNGSWQLITSWFMSNLFVHFPGALLLKMYDNNIIPPSPSFSSFTHSLQAILTLALLLTTTSLHSQAIINIHSTELTVHLLEIDEKISMHGPNESKGRWRTRTRKQRLNIA